VPPPIEAQVTGVVAIADPRSIKGPEYANGLVGGQGLVGTVIGFTK